MALYFNHEFTSLISRFVLLVGVVFQMKKDQICDLVDIPLVEVS